ncbi:anti-sigma factor antagonist, partial [Porticoccaceae bacterium]|nr:anti-sigma factor antagonist [Porticoccaceae bacterium]
MTGGKILSFDRQGNYLLKFTGDVRMTLCGSLNGHIDRILGGEGVERVVIDMLSAEGLDST